MAAEAGEMFRCDRAEKAHANGQKTVAFMGEHDKARDDWEKVKWMDANGVEIEMLLCPECLETFNKIRTDQRKQTQAFMYEQG